MDRVIRRLTEEVARQSGESPYREVARKTHALPAHVDMGGALILMPNGQIMLFDHESEEISEPSARWKTLARIKLAKRYKELGMLSPRRPKGAYDCVRCDGEGFIGDFACDKCWGTGWLKSAE